MMYEFLFAKTVGQRFGLLGRVELREILSELRVHDVLSSVLGPALLYLLGE